MFVPVLLKHLEINDLMSHQKQSIWFLVLMYFTFIFTRISHLKFYNWSTRTNNFINSAGTIQWPTVRQNHNPIRLYKDVLILTKRYIDI